MKKISKIMIFLFLSAFSLVGCSDLLDVDSNRLVFPDEYNMTAANDTLYSMFGIFSQLEKISNSYVLLGELRGELMDATDNSSVYLKEINNFDISSKNPYANNIKDYYSVINNCNYVIHNIDTSIVKGSVKVMQKEYAASKAIRAWTYMQIALNYGSVTYYDKPILTLEDAQKAYPEYTMEELVPVLIADLTPWKDVEEPKFGLLYTHFTTDSFFPIRLLLGDLYLWKGTYSNDPADYESAANEYHDLMFKNYCIMSPTYKSSLEVVNNAFTGDNTIVNWLLSFNTNNSEVITAIASTNEYGNKFDLDSLTLNHMIAPSSAAINNWDSQMYYYSNTLDTVGDLRKYGSVSTSKAYPSDNVTTSTKNYIYKYILINPILDSKKTDKQVMPYRVTLLYLRYAEAVNRLGKPNLALAVLKNGLNKINMLNKKIIPQHELTVPIQNYMDFNNTRFDNNIGVRMRGLGNVNLDTTSYIIPRRDALSDSIVYVEDLIQQELALETAFEGNRFHDLMRIAIRRNDNYYLANIVASKHTDNKEAIRNKLGLTRDYWYLKK